MTTVVDALVVAVRPSGDTALVVELLTRDAGRVSCVARAARRSQKRFMGGLDPLCRVDAELEPPRRGDLHQLVHSVVTDPHMGLRADPEALGRAAYVAELAAALAPRDHAAGDVLDVVLDVFRVLGAGPCGPGLLRWAEVVLLSDAGVLPPTDRCHACGAPLEGQVFHAAVSPGTLRCPRCVTPADVAMGGACAALLSACAGWDAEAAARADVSPAASVEAGRWLQGVLQPAVGRRLRSAKFLAQLQRHG